jgi:hypothetical protein
MVAIPETGDPTLEAADRVMEAAGNRRPSGTPSLPLGNIGNPCERAMWYGFRWADKVLFNAKTLKLFADGNAGEDVMATRLRLVPGLDLWTIDPGTGKQFEVRALNGHVVGRVDGVVVGLLQAPRTPHVWENKVVNEKSFKLLKKHIEALGEKAALEKWNPKYYATAQCYMHLMELTRHYLTVGTPGMRDATSCRTEYNREVAESLIERARIVIDATRAPARIADDPDGFLCRFCDFNSLCYGRTPAQKNCRTCLSSTPTKKGIWECERFELPLDRDEQRKGCGKHLFVPSLVAGEQIDADDNGEWVEYRMHDGSVWKNWVKG